MQEGAPMNVSPDLNCGEWKLSKEIGRGAYGVVYMAVNSSGKRVAVKICQRDDVGENRYNRELRGAKLYKTVPKQEGLIGMMDLVETDWGFYTVMELADDEFGTLQEPSSDYRPKTLASVIDGEKALPLTECVKLAFSLVKGLAALQRYHLLHRDIKPANVLYVNGKPVLSDPGLVVEESEAASLVGTPGYVPPEQFTDAASDIYSLGLTLKAASFGRQIEDLDKGPAMEADTGAKLFPAWWRMLNKATDQTPACRYQSAKALLKDVERLQRRVSICSIVKSRITKVLLLIFTIALVALVAFLAFIAKDANEQQRVDLSKISQNAAVEARAAESRMAFRNSFNGISEEELSFLVDVDRRDIFGGTVSEEEREKVQKIIRKYLGLDKMIDDMKKDLESLDGISK